VAVLQQAQRLFGVGKRIRKLGGHAVPAVAEAAAECRRKWQAALMEEERQRQKECRKEGAKPEVWAPTRTLLSPAVAQVPSSRSPARPTPGPARTTLARGILASRNLTRAPICTSQAKPATKEEEATPSKDVGGGAEKGAEQENGPPGGSEDGTEEVPGGAGGMVIKTGDPGRDRVRELFREGLLKASAQFPDKDCGIIASDVEGALHVLFEAQGGAKSKDYKAKARSLMFNLRDEKNPDLRGSVLSGDVPPEALVKMEPKDLASKHMKERNARIVEEATRNAMGPSANVESTDQFQCGKCKQRKCTYYQMQTRSADEPMTTFVTCIVCNNRWKFC